MVIEGLRNCRVYHVFSIMCIIASAMMITNLFYAAKAVFTITADLREKPTKHEKEPMRDNYYGLESRFDETRIEAKTKNEWKILVFTGMYVLKQWHEFAKIKSILNKHNEASYKITCSEHNSTITLKFGSSTKLLDHQDATVFGLDPYSLKINFRELQAISDRPRYNTQSWIFYAMETPLKANKLIRNIGNFNVDYTWSYLSSADIYAPYAYLEPRATISHVNIARTKTKLLAWMENKCSDVSRPVANIVDKLNNVVGVDTYGKCGNIKCSSKTNCTELMSQYKFHLVIEDAECDEYMTDKLWVTSLSNNVVPIVYGAPKEDYFRYAPRYSFIHLSDFQNITHLAEFIKLLDKSDDLYNKFFQWKKNSIIKSSYPPLKPSSFCSLIPTLKNRRKGADITRKPLKLGSWFKSCRNKPNLYM